MSRRLGEEHRDGTAARRQRSRDRTRPGSRASSSSVSVAWLIEYVVHPPALAPHLAAHLRGQGYDVSSYGPRVWATHPTAADPTEERLVISGVIAAWRRDHPDARIDLHPAESDEAGLSF